jgi:hypothetical protein
MSQTINAMSLLTDPAYFEHSQRVAKLYGASQLVPKHLQGQTADIVIALTMAAEMGENPIIVLQSIYFVNGRAGWSAQYMIARANRSGIFRGRIDWRVEGAGEGLVVTAYATLKDSGQEVSVSASMQMARAEGWTSNKKYQSMPELMLRYRSASMLIRLYAGDVMLGYHTVEEIETMPEEVEVRVVQPAQRSIDAAPQRLAIEGTAEVISQDSIIVRPEPDPVAPTPSEPPRARIGGALITELEALEARVRGVSPDLIGLCRNDAGIVEPLSGNSTAKLTAYKAALAVEAPE